MADKTKLQCDNCFGDLVPTAVNEYWECLQCGVKYHISIPSPKKPKMTLPYVPVGGFSCTYVAETSATYYGPYSKEWNKYSWE